MNINDYKTDFNNVINSGIYKDKLFDRRKKSFEKFLKIGLPTKKWESWKHTKLSKLNKPINPIIKSNKTIHNELILETKNVSEKFATKLLNEVKIKRSRLNKKMLFEEQSTVIAKINKEFPNSVFTNYVPTYKYLASIGQFFNNRNLKPKVKIILEEKIIEYMIQEPMIGVIPKQ